MLPRIIHREPLLQVRARRREFSQPEQDISEHIVPAQEQGRIALPLGQDAVTGEVVRRQVFDVSEATVEVIR